MPGNEDDAVDELTFQLRVAKGAINENLKDPNAPKTATHPGNKTLHRGKKGSKMKYRKGGFVDWSK